MDRYLCAGCGKKIDKGDESLCCDCIKQLIGNFPLSWSRGATVKITPTRYTGQGEHHEKVHY